MILTQVLSEVRTADAERVKNFRRAVTTCAREAKPLRYDITGTVGHPQESQTGLVHGGSHGRQ